MFEASDAMAAFNKPALGETELSTQLRDELSPVFAASWQSAS